MKRFLVFAEQDYYPCGGLGDVRGSFDTAEEAIAFARSPDIAWYTTVYVWDRIADVSYDVETGKAVDNK